MQILGIELGPLADFSSLKGNTGAERTTNSTAESSNPVDLHNYSIITVIYRKQTSSVVGISVPSAKFWSHESLSHPSVEMRVYVHLDPQRGEQGIWADGPP